jgi:hypothetical protein
MTSCSHKPGPVLGPGALAVRPAGEQAAARVVARVQVVGPPAA